MLAQKPAFFVKIHLILMVFLDWFGNSETILDHNLVGGNFRQIIYGGVTLYLLNNLFLFAGSVRNVSPSLWQMTHLTCLYLNDNNLVRLPAEIQCLTMLRLLDLSCNKLRSLPAELGELIYLR